MLKYYSVCCLLILASLPQHSIAQGCSDAGFCSSPTLQAGTDTTTLKNSFHFGIGYGAADYDIGVINGFVSYSRKLTSQLAINGRLNWQQNKGEEATTESFSDAFFMLAYNITKKLEVTLGIKAALADGNVKKDGIPLPMDYQPGLGTTDLLIGAAFHKENYGVSIGYQQPLTQNRNEFDASVYEEGDSFYKFQTTNGYTRSGDVLMRLFYVFPVKNTPFSIAPSLLPIYHLKDDTYEDASGEDIQIKGSQGLTLNGNVTVRYIKGNNVFEAGFATPFIVRDSRPDGLTRSLVMSLDYRIAF